MNKLNRLLNLYESEMVYDELIESLNDSDFQLALDFANEAYGLTYKRYESETGIRKERERNGLEILLDVIDMINQRLSRRTHNEPS